ncbi:hypothetical protein BGZ65_010567, partial [Modicella reniformis]
MTLATQGPSLGAVPGSSSSVALVSGDGDGGGGGDGDMDDEVLGLMDSQDGLEEPDESFTMIPGLGHHPNWKQRSRILENVEIEFKTPNQFPSNTVIIGIDPGGKYPLTAAKIDPRNPQDREIVRIFRRFLNKSYSKLKKILERRKTAAGIAVIEESGIGTKTNLVALKDFYNAMVPTTQMGTPEGTEGVLGLWGRRYVEFGRRRHHKKKPRNLNVVICVGLASFGAGTSSKHGSLIRKLVDKAKPLATQLLGAMSITPRPSALAHLRQIPRNSAQQVK